MENNVQLHDHTPAVLVPLEQAAVSGFLVGLVMFTITSTLTILVNMFRAWAWPEYTASLNLWPALFVAVATFVIFMTVFWFWRVAVRWDALTSIEVATGIDLNGDGQIGEPEKVVKVRVERRHYDESGNYSGTDYEEQDARLLKVAEVLSRVGPAGERYRFSFDGMVKKSGAFTQPEFKKLVDDWIRDGYCKHKIVNGKAVSTELTDKAISAINSIIEASPTEAE